MNLHVLACIPPPPPPPSTELPNQISTKQPLHSRLVWPPLSCFLVIMIIIWAGQSPFFYDFLFSFFLFFMHAALDGFTVESPNAEGCCRASGRPGTHWEEIVVLCSVHRWHQGNFLYVQTYLANKRILFLILILKGRGQVTDGWEWVNQRNLQFAYLNEVRDDRYF